MKSTIQLWGDPPDADGNLPHGSMAAPAMTRSVASLISAMEMAFLFRRAARMADLGSGQLEVGGEGRILSIYLATYLAIYLSTYLSI